MPDLEDVAALVAPLPGAEEGLRRGSRTWAVGGRTFAWERPYTKADIKRFGDEQPPREPIVAVRVADLHEKEAVLAEQRDGVFTIPHFNGFPAVLVELDAVARDSLRELVVDAYLACAPAAVARAYLDG